MSSGGFHVHGPHDHAVEHATHGHDAAHHGADHGGGSSTNKIAMFTAIVATVGAIFAYMGGATQANAGLMKNDAAIKKTEASNQWNYFQSKSTKQSLAELARDLTPAEHHRWAQATTALQVAIALAAIALLTKKKWLEYGMYGVAAVGLGVGALAFLHI